MKQYSHAAEWARYFDRTTAPPAAAGSVGVIIVAVIKSVFQQVTQTTRCNTV